MKNRLLMYFTIFASVVVTIILTFFLLLHFEFTTASTTLKTWVSILIALLSLTDVAMLFATYLIIKRKRENIKASFDHYVEEQVSASGIGVLIFNNDQDIIWCSRFVEERLGRNIIGKKLISLSEDFARRYENGDKSFKFDLEGITFQVKVNVESKTIIFKDVTNDSMILKQYVSEKLVIGEIDVDNYAQLQVTLSEEELFKIQSNIIKMLDSLTTNYNFIYRQYVNGKYIFFTNQDSLEKLVKNNFDFLDEIRKVQIMDGIFLTASIGIGTGTSYQKELAELARDGLKQAQARGGDQVAIMELNRKPRYFGSKAEIGKTLSRVKIKQTAELLEAKLSSKKIKNVIIYGHVYADLDAVGSAMGVAAIANHFNKEVMIQNATFDKTTGKVLKEFLTKEDQAVFVRPSKASKETDENSLVIIVDTAELHRIENENALKKAKMENVFVLDHHRVSQLPEEIPATNIYIDTAASSASEIVTELFTFFSESIRMPKQVAQMLLNGIYLDTTTFTKSTSSRTYQAASILEQNGASSNIASEILKMPEEAYAYIKEITKNLQEIKPGYFMATYEGEVPGDIISMAADEVLRTQGRKAAFVVAKVPGRKEFKLSARGIETNVQTIAEEVGGGGHFGAAAAVSDESLPVFVDNIRQAIVSKRGDE